MKKFGILCIIVCLVFDLPLAEPARFRRVIRLYDNYDLFSEERKINLDINYYKQWPDIDVESPALDTSSFFMRRVYGDFCLQFKKMVGSPLLDRNLNFSVASVLSQHIRGYSLRGRNTSDSYEIDTATSQISLLGEFSNDYRCYFKKPDRLFISHLLLGINTDWELSYGKEENIEPPFPDSLMPAGKFKKRTSSFSAVSDISPGIGIGKQSSVLYVYHAFEIEKNLLRTQAINFPLSEKTLAALASFLARNHTFRLRDYNKLKEFKAQLDSIIIQDAAAEREKLRYISPFEVKRVLLRSIPVIMQKPRLQLYTTQRLLGTAEYSNINYPKNIFVTNNDTAFTDYRLKHDAVMGMNFDWGIPLNRFMFLSLQGNKHFISKRRGIEFYRNEKMDFEKLIENSWNMHLLLFLGNKILLEGIIDGVPSHIIVPKDIPYLTCLNFNMYIEEYISVQVYASFYYSKTGDRNMSEWSRPLGMIYHGFSPGINVTYRF